MYEELFFNHESVTKTLHPKIFVVTSEKLNQLLLADINRIEVNARYYKYEDSNFMNSLREELERLIPGSNLCRN